ncbi:DNRLRE domain-containing protein [Haloferula sp. BvORR071]|uniref:DNRLRE domain-containing protein n=1 Tax=Haloferula sp. BvORR071 TaxID=1396141 RepID=UPI0005535E34|nr:DNRLRE domain-containing protein [Haloferula sp. BvORR071]
MKITRSFSRLLAAAFACLSMNLAHGLTIPVSADTTSTLGPQQAQLLSAKAGSATTLGAGPKQTAFIRFEAGSYADVNPAATIEKAWLMVYLSEVAKPGALKVHAVTQNWTEVVEGKPVAPTFLTESIATIPAESVVAKQFVLVDVTAQVKSWLTSPATDFGFAIASDGAASVQLGSKDGPSKGYAAVLQIEKKSTINTPEDLRTIRGTVEVQQDGTLAIIAGQGFTVEKVGSDLKITFSTPFSGLPTISSVGEGIALGGFFTPPTEVSASGVTLDNGAAFNSSRAHFIAVGPR